MSYHNGNLIGPEGCDRKNSIDKETIDAINGTLCGDCNDTGMLENRVEGRYPCTCITETDYWVWNEEKIKNLESQLEVMYNLVNQLKMLFCGDGCVCCDEQEELVDNVLAKQPARSYAIRRVLHAATDYIAMHGVDEGGLYFASLKDAVMNWRKS